MTSAQYITAYLLNVQSMVKQTRNNHTKLSGYCTVLFIIYFHIFNTICVWFRPTIRVSVLLEGAQHTED